MSQSNKKLMISLHADVRAFKSQMQASLQELHSLVKREFTVNVDTNLDGVQDAIQETGESFKDMSKQAVQSLETISEKINGPGGSIAKLGLFLQGLSQVGRVAKSIIGDTVSLAREQLQAELLVAGAVRATGGAAGRSAEQLKLMASELQAVSNYGDEEILKKVTNRLLAYPTIVGKTFDTAQKAILDMSAAMGSDLASTTEMVGKALEHPVEGLTSLTRVGFRFSETQKEMIKNFVEMNDMASAQKVILDEINSVYAGQSENVIDQIIQMKNAFGDLRESVGGVILPLLQDLAFVLKWVTWPFVKLLEHLRTFPLVCRAMTIAVTAYIVKLALKKAALLATTKSIVLKTIAMKANVLSVKLATFANATWIVSIKKVIAALLIKIGVANMSKGVVLGLVGAIALLVVSLIRWAKAKKEVILAEKEAHRQALASIDYVEILAENQGRRLERLRLQLQNEQITIEEVLEDVTESYNLMSRVVEEFWVRDTGRRKEDNIFYQRALADKLGIEKEIEDKHLETEREANEKRAEFAKQLQDKLRELKNAIDDDETKLRERHAREVALLNETKNINAQYTADSIALSRKHSDEINELRKKELDNIISIRKSEAEYGIITYSQLTDALNQYINDVSKLYADDTIEYRQALKQRTDAQKGAIEEVLKIEQEKYDLDLIGYEQLVCAMNDYISEIASLYGEDTINHRQALQIKAAAEKKHSDDQKQRHERVLQGLQDTFSRSQRLFELKLFNKAQVKASFDEYVVALNETINDTEIEIQRLRTALVDVEDDTPEFRTMTDELTELQVELETLRIAVGDAGDDFQSFLENNMTLLEQFGKTLKDAGRSIVDGFADSFAQAIVYGKKFSESMKSLFKNLVSMLISELMRLMVWKAIFAMFPGAQSFFFGTPAVGAASGGYIQGPGTGTSDSIPARLSNGEYVINARKTSIFKPLLDMINYAPLQSVQQALAGLQMPTFNVPQLPVYAYSTGGYVSPGGWMDISNLERRIDNMSDRLAGALERIENKEYNVQVNSHIKGIELVREIQAAQKEYDRVLK